MLSLWTWHPSFKGSFPGLTASSLSPNLKRRASLLTPLPSKDTWIKVGTVERRTVHANVIWRERQLILTKDCIFFGRIDSDLVVDKIYISEIVSIAKVDSGSSNISEERNSKKPNFKSSKRRRSSVLTNISRSDNYGSSFCETSREMYAFEIKAMVGNFQRSYFVRVKSAHECEFWIAAVMKCLNSTMREFTEKHSWIQKQQRCARSLQSKHNFRCFVAFLILLDFLSSVFKSELLPTTDSPLLRLFELTDIVLFVLFCLELLLNMFGHWRTPSGAPFCNRFTSWFQVRSLLNSKNVRLLLAVLIITPEITR